MTKHLGHRVAEKRQQRGYTQKELAETIKRMFPYFKGGQSTIQAIESGQSKKPTILYELARALNCSEQYLMTGVSNNMDTRNSPRDLDDIEKEMNVILHNSEIKTPYPQRPTRQAPSFLQNPADKKQIEAEQTAQDKASSEIKQSNIQRFASAVLGSYQMLGLDEDEANALLEIVTEVAVEPLIPGAELNDLESRRLLASSLTRRFLRTKHA